VVLFYEPQLLKKLQVSVDCGQANPGVPLSCPAIQLVGIDMSAALTEQLKQQGTLSCHSLARTIQYLTSATLLFDYINHLLAPNLFLDGAFFDLL
jgi:hypothetical protein